VVVIQGAAGHFCAGADLTGVEDTEFVQLLRRVLLGLHTIPIPTLAAVEGAALGAGTQLAVACDLRMATADAQFGIPAAKLGLMVDQWTVERLTQVAGEGPARAMLLAAEVYRGEAAHAVGMVQRIGTPAEAAEWAEAIASLAPLTIAGHKLGLNGAADDEYGAAFRRAWSSADLQEGMAAFHERRPARFAGE
jgi:enoyl-CoA hydratase